MTMPKKGRREITVNDVLYHYMIKRYSPVVIQNTETQKITTISFEDKFWVKWGGQIKPSQVKGMILAGDDHSNFENYMEPQTCNCGAVGSKSKRMCAFDAEIRMDATNPKYCACCTKCRLRCEDEI